MKMEIHKNVLLDLTSLLGFPNDEKYRNVKLLAKCEFMTPGFSVEDRVAQKTFEVLKSEDRLKPGTILLYKASSDSDERASSLGESIAIGFIILISNALSQVSE